MRHAKDRLDVVWSEDDAPCRDLAEKLYLRKTKWILDVAAVRELVSPDPDRTDSRVGPPRSLASLDAYGYVRIIVTTAEANALPRRVPEKC